jgi:hypothetical protein
MRKPSLAAVLAVAAAGISAVPGNGQTLPDFIPEKICAAGSVDRRLFMQAALGQKKCDDCLSPRSIEKAAANWTVKAFLKHTHEGFPGSYRVLSVPHAPDGGIDYEEYVRTVDQRIRCVADAAPLRSRLDELAKSVGKAVQIRKDVDNLGSGDLSSAKPASFAFVRDWEAGNTVHSYEIAVGRLFKGALDPSRQMDVPFTLLPYARFVGQINADPKKRDIDNAAFGLRGDLYAIPFLGLEHRLSLRAEYLTDSAAEASIAAGEFVWEPRPPFEAGFPHPFGHPQYYFGSSGPYLKVDLTGRVRFGHVFDPGLKPTVLTEESYLRLGAKAGATVGFGGYDILSSLSLFATYLWFDTVDGAGGTFAKLEAGVNYQITDNFGITLKYVEGTDEDKLEPVQRFDAGFTVKF